MKHEKISIKWRVFTYLLVFTGILLVVLWLIQICYLDSFYTMIKSREAEQVTSAVANILTSDEDDKDTLIHDIAAKNNMAVYVTNTDGNEICSAEYIVNSRLADMPSEQVQYYYEQAKEHGGIFKIEYEGGINPEFWSEDMPEPEDVAYGPGFHGFLQKRGQEHIKSVIYVKIVECDGQEEILLVNTQLTPVDATVNTLRIELIWITVIMILLSLGIALLISRQISKSLIRINESAKALAKGDFDVRFEGKDYREVAELSDTLNATAKELGKNESLRRELIANVSHDLRTPLTMIIAYAEVMRDLPGENTPENVQVVIDEAGRLTNLVNDMLDMSKLQAGVMEKNDTVYNLTESIESVLERYNKLKEQDGYCIHFEYDGKVQVVNNQRISVTMRQSVLDAKMLAEQGKGAEEIKEILEKEKFESSIYIMVDTLEYLKKGGRITPAAAALGTLLKLKPVLQIQGEKLDAFAKTRGVKQAKKKMIAAVRKELEERFQDGDFGKHAYLQSAYTKDEEAALKWKEELMAEFPGMEFQQDPLSLSVACHIGAGALAVAWTHKIDD